MDEELVKKNVDLTQVFSIEYAKLFKFIPHHY